ncbi:hypothetical protein S40293_11164, partial [Stachybotrys chartarum IBT 40293]
SITQCFDDIPGPKLEPFVFKGPREIEFLDELGVGGHSFLFKVRIDGVLYALKLVSNVDRSFGKFVMFEEFILRGSDTRTTMEPNPSPEDMENMDALANYSDSFNCECRAFGRLKQAGGGSAWRPLFWLRTFGRYSWTNRSRETGRPLRNVGRHGDGKVPFKISPGRKASPDSGYRQANWTRIQARLWANWKRSSKQLKNIYYLVRGLHRVGIFNLDVRLDQIVNNRFAGSSTAFTTPHYVASQELNPKIAPELVPILELE